MKAITICQPYAELIVRGQKRVENRSWRTHYRGWLAIHAGKSREWLRLGPNGVRDLNYDLHVQNLAFGAVVGVARLVDCLAIEAIDRGDHDRQYPWLRDHVHTEGPWCWVLSDVRRLDQRLPWKGKQGFFEVPLLPESSR